MRILEQALKDMMDEDLRELLGPATVEEHGDLALPCHSLAPIRKRSPADFALWKARKEGEDTYVACPFYSLPVLHLCLSYSV